MCAYSIQYTVGGGNTPKEWTAIEQEEEEEEDEGFIWAHAQKPLEVACVSISRNYVLSNRTPLCLKGTVVLFCKSAL